MSRQGAGRVGRQRESLVRLRPTAAGWLVLGVAVLVGVAGAELNSPLAIFMGGAMLAAAAFSPYWAWRTLSRLRALRHLAGRAREWEPSPVRYELTNRRRWFGTLGVGLRELAVRDLNVTPVFYQHLPGKATVSAESACRASRRGRFSLRGLRLSTTFPFGLVVATRPCRQEAELVVWPARGRLKTDVFQFDLAEAETMATRPLPGGQGEILGLREYRPGDRPRQIHWRRSAGRRVPVVREMALPKPDEVWIVLDTFLPKPSKQETALLERFIRLAATLAESAPARRLRAGLALALPSGVAVIPPTGGATHLRRMLDALADAAPNKTCPLEGLLARVLRHVPRDAQLILLTPGSSPDGQPLRLPRAVGCHLTLITAKQLNEVFEDPLPKAGEARP